MLSLAGRRPKFAMLSPPDNVTLLAGMSLPEIMLGWRNRCIKSSTTGLVAARSIKSSIAGELARPRSNDGCDMDRDGGVGWKEAAEEEEEEEAEAEEKEGTAAKVSRPTP
jgi:hypothetical protein